MSAHLGYWRRPRKAPVHKSFRPTFDVLENRALPSGLSDGLGLPPLPGVSAGFIIDPGPGGPQSDAAVTVSTSELKLTRGGDPASFTVVLNSQPTAEVDVTLSQFSRGGGGPAPATAANTSLTLSPVHLAFTPDKWSTAQPVQVSAPAGNGPDDQVVWVFGTTSSSDANFDAQAVPPVRVDVFNNQANPAGVIVSTDDLEVTRGGAPATYTVVLASQPTADVTVTIRQVSPWPDPSGPPDFIGDQLTITPPTLTFTAQDWDTPQTVTVAAADATSGPGAGLARLEETVTSADPNYDNLPAPALGVKIEEPQPTGNVVISTDHLEVKPGGDAVTYTVALASQPTADVTVTLSQFNPVLDPPGPRPLGATGIITPGPNDGDGPLTITPPTLTFTAADWNTPQTVTVSAPADVGLISPVVIISAAVSSDDANYNDLSAPNVYVKVEQNQPTGGVVVSTDHLDVSRGGDAASYTIALASQPTADVTITITQGDLRAEPDGGPGKGGNAIAWPLPGGDPLQIAPTTLTFTPDNWATPQPVKVGPPTTGVGDQYDWLIQTATSDDPNYNGIPIPSVQVKVTDPNAEQAGLVFSQQSLQVQPGGTVTYTVALAAKPSADVTVTIAQGPGLVPLAANGAATDPVPPIGFGGGPTLTIAPTTLTFTPDNWDTPQTVTITAPVSQDGSPARGLAWLTHTVTSDDPYYNKLFVASVAVFVGDDKGIKVPPLPLPPVAVVVSGVAAVHSGKATAASTHHTGTTTVHHVGHTTHHTTGHNTGTGKSHHVGHTTHHTGTTTHHTPPGHKPRHGKH